MSLLPLFRRFNMIIVIFVLVQIINVFSDEETLMEYNLIVATSPYVQSYDGDDFNVITMYKISNSLIGNKSGAGFKDDNFRSIYDGKYSIELYPKINSIGLIPFNISLKDHLPDIIIPSNISNNTIFQNGTLIKVHHAKHWRYNNITTFGYYCDADNYHTDCPDDNTDHCFDAFEYHRREVVHILNSKKNIILTIEWQPRNHLNSLRVLYIFKRNIYFDIEINVHDKNNKVLYTSLLNTSRNITQLIIKSTLFDDNEKYKIIFSKKSNAHHTNIDNMTPFSIFQIANYFQTSDSGYESKNIPDLLPKKRRPSSCNVFSSSNDHEKYVTTHITTDSSAINCLNGGFRLKDRCMCPPGFRGVFCQEGCGPNKFGADCSGLCSMFITNGCRGIYFCTSSYGCTCSAGLTGRFCNEDCPPNTYGANCNQNCSSDCINKTCDQYTGLCTHGRLQGDKSTSCTEKCVAYLRHPPKLVAAGHETITVEINFDSENIIGNDGHKQVKYYQLLWKDFNENTYHHTQIKPLNSNKSNETVKDLKPGTEYNIGVLIIMDDGNINKEEDIVYGLYNTTCLENPSISEYNYQVIAGLRSITITWNKVSIEKCPVKELSLTLYMTNHDRKSEVQTYSIIPSSNQSYLIQNLIPGYEYSVDLTPRTTMGDLTSPYTFKVKPKFTDEDVTIKNITAKYVEQNKTIVISWKPVIHSFGLNDYNVETSLTYTVKYKINRIFSCSIEEIKNDWISYTINNSTDYKIQNVTPHIQYVIQVIMNSEDKNTIQRENIVYVLTPASLPTLIPTFEQTLNVTCTSATIKWKLDNSNCSSINGIYKGFFLVLKNINNNTENTIRTENNNITFNDLKPMNDYELKVFVENNIGHSPEHFLLIPFSAATNGGDSVSDLVIYKMNPINHTLGLRWRYLNKTAEKFLISIVYDNTSEIQPNKTSYAGISCTAWPSYYCTSIPYLNPYNNFSVKVEAKLSENKEGGETSITCCNNRNKTPDPPQNLKVSDIQNKTSVTLKWDIPWNFYSELKSFIIHVFEIESLTDIICCDIFVPVEIPFQDEKPTYEGTVSLKPSYKYSIYVVSTSIFSVHSLPSNVIEVTT